MHLIMFDIDGTLTQSYDFDSLCFVNAVRDVLAIEVDDDWSQYPHVTDAGILEQIILRHAVPESQRASAHQEVKASYLRHLRHYLQQHGVQQVAGAQALLALLRGREDVLLAIATGGWQESACLKLAAAGLDVAGIAIASSNDHYERRKIMQIAAERALAKAPVAIHSKSYLGDGVWDKNAALALDYNFVLVGERLQHHQQIVDFSNVRLVLTHLGLSHEA